ncbi:MAG: hypothetical protein E6G37_00080 [Actinobacteria bacterium]|nr:MAG: hypothetical protein E6G63_00345 [Actinomycetota bacterium]TMK18245.1 MAG: hypothetical protein E6G65_12530 [Actinomycetota bacterium]TMK95367.1 MAG: hypothetical protein E6G37_00080 [Actinomycetota bacterium]TMM24611.1 MAG: hypothetical protein E6F95_03625 [Actinomycetota bacterium]
MSPTLRAAALTAAVALAATGCNRSGQEQAASLCQDMRNLRATVSFLVAPSAGATVGQVRGDIEKLASTIGAIDGSDTVPDAMGKALSDARDDYQDVLHGIGDDDPFSEVAAEAAAPAHRLGGAFDAVAQHLACDQTPSG